MESIISTIIVCAVIAVICVIGVLKYIKNLKSGCCGSGGDTIKRVKPQDSNADNYSFAYKIVIDGMTCKNCAMRVENAFNEKENFLAKVKLSEKSALVRTKTEIAEKELRDIVIKAGYIPMKVEKL
ncbi:cation transporter [Ruminococcus sp.]|uniref:cation transporter n=1 Tax=Ruminococcus sp. TaxID=41978 RepID=UPI00386925A5